MRWRSKVAGWVLQSCSSLGGEFPVFGRKSDHRDTAKCLFGSARTVPSLVSASTLDPLIQVRIREGQLELVGPVCPRYRSTDTKGPRFNAGALPLFLPQCSLSGLGPLRGAPSDACPGSVGGCLG